MEIPFLKNKNKNQGGGVMQVSGPSDNSSDDALLDSIGQEFLDAISRKDIKALRAALEALITMIQDQDKEQDAEDMK